MLLAEEMVKAGEEEREMAITEKMFEGVPAIGVTVDGGWSKRSHKHSYNARLVIIDNTHKKAPILGSSEQILFYLCSSIEQRH